MKMKNVETKILKGAEALPYVTQIIQMNIDLFSKFPYLYKGSPEGCLSYLDIYFKSPNGRMILLFNKEKLVGFSSAIPLMEYGEELYESFIDNQLDPNKFLYIGSIMLAEEYRSWKFVYDILNIHYKTAAEFGLSYLTAITVDRPGDHSWKPANYRTLDKLWERFGWKKFPSLEVEIP